MSKPIWLLDFDGVINALSSKGDRSVWDRWNSTEITVPDDDTYQILWSDDVVELVAYAVDSGISVIWLTTWREHTKLISETLTGMPEALPWWDESTMEDAGHKLDPCKVLGQKWKVQVAQALLPNDANVLWTDDQLPYILNGTDRGWFARRSGITSYINPQPTIGLSKSQVREVREWIEENV